MESCEQLNCKNRGFSAHNIRGLFSLHSFGAFSHDVTCRYMCDMCESKWLGCVFKCPMENYLNRHQFDGWVKKRKQNLCIFYSKCVRGWIINFFMMVFESSYVFPSTFVCSQRHTSYSWKKSKLFFKFHRVRCLQSEINQIYFFSKPNLRKQPCF